MIDFLGSTPVMIGMAIALVLLCLVAPPLLAARKGYAWYLWVFGGGLLGLVVLAFLPYANRPDQPAEANRAARKTGNIVGGVLSLISLVGMAVQFAAEAAGLP